MTAFTGSIMTTVLTSEGAQDGYGVPKLTALASSGINPIPHYKLACYDSLGVRNFWVDTAVSLTNAPTPAGGATYVSATLTNLGRY